MSDVSVFQFEVFNFSRFSASCIWIISPLCRNVKWSFWCFVCFGHLNLSSFSQRWTKILWITIQFTLDLFVFPMGVESVIPEAIIWEGSTPAGLEVPFSPAAPADTFGPLPEKPSQVRVVWRWLSPPPLAPNPPPSAWESLGLFQSSRSHPAENSRKQPPGLLSMSLKHRGSLRPGIMSESPFLKMCLFFLGRMSWPSGEKGVWRTPEPTLRTLLGGWGAISRQFDSKIPLEEAPGQAIFLQGHASHYYIAQHSEAPPYLEKKKMSSLDLSLPRDCMFRPP